MKRAILFVARGLACLPSLLSVLLLALLPVPAGAQSGELSIQAERFAFDTERELYTYEEGRLTLEGLSIFAPLMVLDAKANQVRASGFIQVQTATLFGTAESLELDLTDRTASFSEAHLFDAARGMFLEAGTAVLYPDGRLELRRCSFTSCPVDVPAPWSLSASEVSLRPGELGLAWNPVFSIGPVPVFWLPGVVWPTVQERSTGFLLPELSSERSSLKRLDLGLRLKVPFFLNLDVDHDLTLIPESIENRGGAMTLEYNYAFWEEQRARLRIFGLKEGNDRRPLEENDILAPGTAAGEDPRPGRFLLDWDHNQGLGEAGRLILSYRHSSDGQVRREYERVTEYRPYRSYQVTLSGQEERVQAALSFEQNADYVHESIYADDVAYTDRDQRPQLQPRVTTRAGMRLGESVPLGVELELTGTRFETRQAVSGNLFTASPALSLPVPLGGAFELRPTLIRHFVGYRALTEYVPDGAEATLPEASFSQTEGSLELLTTVARIFPREEGRYTALKHRITPRLIFTGVEDVPQPFTAPDRLLRARVAERLLTLRLDNSLVAQPRTLPAGAEGPPEAESAPPPVRELVQVDLIQRYNFLLQRDAPVLEGPGFDGEQETSPGQPLLPLVLSASMKGEGYGINLSLHYHHQLERITRTNIALEGTSGAHLRMAIRYAFNEFTHVTPDNKLVPRTNSFAFEGEMAFTDRTSLGFNGRLNLQDDTPPLERRLDQGQLFVEYHPICYAVRLSYEEAVNPFIEDGETRYSLDRRVRLSFNLRGLGAARQGPPSLFTPAGTGATVGRMDTATRCYL